MLTVGIRQFDSVQQLIDSGNTKGIERELLGDYIYIGGKNI